MSFTGPGRVVTVLTNARMAAMKSTVRTCLCSVFNFMRRRTFVTSGPTDGPTAETGSPFTNLAVGFPGEVVHSCTTMALTLLISCRREVRLRDTMHLGEPQCQWWLVVE